MKKKFWDCCAPVYDLAMKKGDAGDRVAAEYIAGYLAPGSTLLEAACGTGRFTCALAPHLAQVCCCDYSQKMVETAKRKAHVLGLDNVSFSIQDVTSLNFPAASFDSVLAANVLHLLPEPEKAVDELVRVVRPGGLLIFPDFVNAESDSSGRRFLKLIGRLGFQPQNEWTSVQFLDFLQDSGLSLVSHRMFISKQPMCVAIARCRDVAF